MERIKSNGGGHVNSSYDPTLDEPPVYQETNFSSEEHRTVRPSVTSAFGHDTLDRVPNIDFYRNAGSVSGQRAVRPSLQELHDVFQKVSGGKGCPAVLTVKNLTEPPFHLFIYQPVPLQEDTDKKLFPEHLGAFYCFYHHGDEVRGQSGLRLG